MRERNIKALGLAEITQHHDCLMTNNPNGVLYAGTPIKFGENGTILLAGARPIKPHINGWPDSSGYRSFVITEEFIEMLRARMGERIAIPVYIEWKSDRGRATIGQQRLIGRFIYDGALAGFARSTEDAVSIVRRFDPQQ